MCHTNVSRMVIFVNGLRADEIRYGVLDELRAQKCAVNFRYIFWDVREGILQLMGVLNGHACDNVQDFLRCVHLTHSNKYIAVTVMHWFPLGGRVGGWIRHGAILPD